MTNKEEIKKLYKQKVGKLLRFNKAYFEKDSPVVSDIQFDELKKELIDLSKRYPYLKKIQDLDNVIGARPSVKFEKIKHSKPMLSLANSFDKEDMIDF